MLVWERTSDHDLAFGVLVDPVGEEEVDVPNHPALPHLGRAQYPVGRGREILGPGEEDEGEFCYVNLELLRSHELSSSRCHLPISQSRL